MQVSVVKKDGTVDNLSDLVPQLSDYRDVKCTWIAGDRSGVLGYATDKDGNSISFIVK